MIDQPNGAGAGLLSLQRSREQSAPLPQLVQRGSTRRTGLGGDVTLDDHGLPHGRGFEGQLLHSSDSDSLASACHVSNALRANRTRTRSA